MEIVDLQLQSPIQTLKIREVLAATKDGSGDTYCHPANPDYDNPISALYYVNTKWACLLFETNNGVVGVHPQSVHTFKRVEVPQNLTMIRVWKCLDNVHCLEFFGKQDYAEAGAFKEDEMQDIPI